jgi:hypothetical protein
MAATTSAAQQSTATQQVDRIEGAIDSIFDSLNERNYEELPPDSVLARDPEACTLMNEMFHPLKIKRSQLLKFGFASVLTLAYTEI